MWAASRSRSTTQGSWFHPKEWFMHDENLSRTSMMSLSSTTTHRGLSLSVLILFVRGFPGLVKCKPDCLEGLWLISHYLHPLIHHRGTVWHTKQALQSRGKEALSNYSWLLPYFPFLTTDRTGAAPGDLAVQSGTPTRPPSDLKHLTQLHTWRSSGNNLHSFHRCCPFKRNADFELHLCFQNIAFSLNLECVTLSTDYAILHSPRHCFYDMTLQ